MKKLTDEEKQEVWGTKFYKFVKNGGDWSFAPQRFGKIFKKQNG